MARLVPGGELSLSHLSDDALLSGTRRLVGATNKLFSQLLLHLAEVETRGIHRTRACSSLYTYCIYELRMSEDAAARRSSAARLVKSFPLLFDAIANGELHLTGLLMLGPHLTPENHADVLARARFRTKKELAKLVRELHPLPRVPDLIEPLRPERPASVREPTWEEWVTSLCPPVRVLKAGEAPGDWANDIVSDMGDGAATSLSSGAPVVSPEEPPSDQPATDAADSFAAPARHDLPPITAPQQYQMQFSTTEEHVRLVERAKALLARSSPGVSLGELHRKAMRLLVEQLEKQKFAVTAPSRKPKESVAKTEEAPNGARTEQQEAASRQRGDAPSQPPKSAPRQRGDAPSQPPKSAPRQRGDAPSQPPKSAPHQHGDAPSRAPNAAARERGRHVPAGVKREVFARDAGCCGYVDARGQRCGETRYLELHHLKPFARGGEHAASNLALRCAAHNSLAAEKDFGRSFVEQKRHSTTHDSLACAADTAAESSGFRGPGDG